jgi:tRNA dimethylallyltransferase
MNSPLPKVLVIGGPTASGKKTFALAAAERFGGEIVSADSRKVYRHIDIGTAKPSLEDRTRIPHHLIDIVEPDEPFSAGEWVRRAADAVRDILDRGKLPIISGGTGFYIEAFREGLSEGIATDLEVRAALERELREKGPETLYRRLAAVDPVRASELAVRDSVRVMRALEIYETAGTTITALRAHPRVTGGEYDYFAIGVVMARDELYRRIDDRVDRMVRDGLVEEVRRMLAEGYARDLAALDTVGYKEWFPFLDGTESFERCLEQVKRDTRRYAKRQLTWFRNTPGICWVDPGDGAAVECMLDEIGEWLAGKQGPPHVRAHAG